MKEQSQGLIKRFVMMIVGIFFIGICVGCYRISAFGVDSFTCLNLGISGLIGMGFGTWQLIMNALILIVVFFTVKQCIGIGTVINMVGIGYMADFICWFVANIWKLELTIGIRVFSLILGSLLAALGVAFYMTANMGMSPYDSVALIIEKITDRKISFKAARIMSDITCVIIGCVFCTISGNSIWSIVGIGTILNALFNGPLIQFFKTYIAEPLLFKTNK